MSDPNAPAPITPVYLPPQQAAMPPMPPAFDPAALQKQISTASASADMAVLMMTIAALSPVLQSMMAFSGAFGQRAYHAVNESAAISMAGLAGAALAAGQLLGPSSSRQQQPPPQLQQQPQSQPQGGFTGQQGFAFGSPPPSSYLAVT